jgi:hypothetical protein
MKNAKLSLLFIVAIAAFMITAAVLVPGHDVMAHSKKKHRHKHSGLFIGGTSTTAIQAADNSQTVANGAGSTGNTATNTPANAQTQTVNSGSTGTG